ncbi:MAG TPA: hypothetical protein VMH86_09790 [Rhizomicrobium sp.]|nr:hypothetical protein [Rhizomicrobium sp.]
MDEQDEHRRRLAATLIGGAVVAGLGIWLAWAMHGYLAHERCLEEGHRFCDQPIDVPR